MAVERLPAPPGTWTRSYPPLVLLVVAVLVAALVLPSALNLPQSNPTTVLEYAPVPPEDDNPPPTEGNLASLGLGGSRTLAEGGTPPSPPPPPPDEGTGERPQQKRCVGNPSRQTEDPMSPPCVPFFDGDNFGATYQGVDEDTIKVLIYLDVGCPNYECSKSEGTYENLDDPALPPCPKTWPRGNDGNCDYIWLRISRGLNRYFNDRFQTYDRRVQYIAYMSGASSASQRRKDAADNWATIKPFAVIDFATYSGHNEAYADAMAARGVLVFTSRTALPNSFFRKNAPMSWGFYPDVERWSEMYASYVCTQVAPFPVRRFGNPPGQGPPNDEERRFGLFYTTDSTEPGLRLFAQLVEAKIAECGVEPVAEGTFPNSGFLVKASDSGRDQAEAVTRFRANDVTTVLYLGGIEGKFSHAADAQKYYPEIVLAGDLENDNNYTARGQNQNVWQNTWGTHLALRIDRFENAPAFLAYKEGNPRGTHEEARFAIEMYRDHFMLFQAIQVAGPRLTPDSIDQGFHAIPTHESTNPYIASCFFDPGDYTCTKDVAEIWWDPAGQHASAPEPGCWRMVNEGRRYLAGRWPGQDTVFQDRSDPCTAFEARFQIDPN